MSFELILTLAAVFGSVALLTGTVISAFVNREAPEQRRLRNLGRSGSSTGVVAASVRVTDTPTDLARRLASFVPRSPKEMSRIQRRLAKAGFHGLMPAVIYSIVELTLPVVVAIAVLVSLPASKTVFLACGFAGVVAYLVPGFWLQHKIALRKKVIENGLPDALDLFIVCLEAGSALDQAIMKATEELGIAYPALAEELRMVTSEIRAGKPRVEAFKNLAERTKVDDVRALVAMLVQTDRFGTSVAQALRTHADVARTKRRQRAEERAAKVGVKLVFPLVFCLFPAFYVVTLGPAVIQFVRVFFGQVMAR
jgi:tight adherence protein C